MHGLTRKTEVATLSLVETHRALSLRRSPDRSSVQRVTAFLPRDSQESLATLLAAFDAIPDALIDNYRFDIAMRYSDEAIPTAVARSHHSDFVRLIGDDISASDLESLCRESSVLLIADPAFDSQAFSLATECGVAVVVITSVELPEVGSGYVGALFADQNRPVSVHVALTHALRFAELQFTRLNSLGELAVRLLMISSDEGFGWDDFELALPAR